MRYTTTQQNVQWLIDQSSKITTDEAFERPYGCWSKDQTNSFLLSLLSGMVSATFVFARTEECGDYCNEELVQDQDKAAGANYFYGLSKEGRRWVSLDSKHRRETIVNFFNNKIAISGEFTDYRGQTHIIKNKTFRELPSCHKHHFLNTGINVVEYTRATRTDLAKIFIAINSGAPLSEQHFRNAMNTPLAAEVRKVIRQFDAFSQLYGPAAQAKMKQHEDFVKIFMHIGDEGQKVSSETLTTLFRKGEEVGLNGSFRSIYPLQTWNSAITVVSELESVISAKNAAKSKKVVAKNVLLYAVALKRALENGYRIDDYVKFSDALEELDKKLENDSMRVFSDDETGRCKTAFYFEWKRQNWGENRQYRAKSLWREMSKAPSTYGLELIQTVEVEEL